MSLNRKESLFWSLAKKNGLIESSESSSLNESEEILRDTEHFTENAFTIMEQICALKERKVKLQLDRINSSHQKRLSLFQKQYDEGISEVANIKVELEFVLHRSNIILRLLQSALKTRDCLPIPLHLQETFITIIKDLVSVSTMKEQSVEYFKNLSVAYNDLRNTLQGTFPKKQQVLRNISLYNSALYNMIKLEEEVDDFSDFLDDTGTLPDSASL